MMSVRPPSAGRNAGRRRTRATTHPSGSEDDEVYGDITTDGEDDADIDDNAGDGAVDEMVTDDVLAVDDDEDSCAPEKEEAVNRVGKYVAVDEIISMDIFADKELVGRVVIRAGMQLPVYAAADQADGALSLDALRLPCVPGKGDDNQKAGLAMFNSEPEHPPARAPLAATAPPLSMFSQ